MRHTCPIKRITIKTKILAVLLIVKLITRVEVTVFNAVGVLCEYQIVFYMVLDFRPKLGRVTGQKVHYIVKMVNKICNS